MNHRPGSREQRAESREQRAESREQKAESIEQMAENREQRKLRKKNTRQHTKEGNTIEIKGTSRRRRWRRSGHGMPRCASPARWASGHRAGLGVRVGLWATWYEGRVVLRRRRGR
jgi:hypothetical protein